MHHGSGYRRLNRTHEHRKAMFANMASSLIEHEQIKTTLPKAKEMKRIIDKLITLGKRGDLHARRIAASELKQDAAVAKLFATLGPRYKERQGGYSPGAEGRLPLWRHGADGDHRAGRSRSRRPRAPGTRRGWLPRRPLRPSEGSGLESLDLWRLECIFLILKPSGCFQAFPAPVRPERLAGPTRRLPAGL